MHVYKNAWGAGVPPAPQTRTRAFLALMAAIVLAVPMLAGADDAVAGSEAVAGTDLHGTWTMTVQGKAPPGKNFGRLTFERDGEETFVVMHGKGGELRGPCQVDGDEIRFEHASPGKTGAVAVFTGRVRGDLMGGALDMGKRGTSAWQAIRDGDEVFDLSGTWTFFQKDLPRDYANRTKLQFSQEGHELVATFTTGDEETVCRGYLDGDAVGGLRIKRPSQRVPIGVRPVKRQTECRRRAILVHDDVDRGAFGDNW